MTPDIHAFLFSHWRYAKNTNGISKFPKLNIDQKYILSYYHSDEAYESDSLSVAQIDSIISASLQPADWTGSTGVTDGIGAIC